MQFKELSQYLLKLEKTSSRNEITQILADLFKKTSPSEIAQVTYLLTGKLLPSYRAVELNIAERLMFQIISKAYNVSSEEVRKAFKDKGDLGAVVEGFAKDKGKDLSVEEVYNRLFELTKEAGKGSQERKITGVANLLSNLDPLSARFVARIPTGKIRLGFSDMTILDALSVMTTGDKSGRKDIEAAFNVKVDIGEIAKEVKEKRLSGLSEIKPTPGTPIRPTLSERLPSVEEILTKIGPKVAVEPKYDGFRAQVHLFNKTVCIFSRNMEDTTLMFPDLVPAIQSIKAKSVILDGEIIACDPKTGKFLPFQETSQRKRKYDIEEMAKKLPITYFVFDILYKDGKSLLSLPFTERRKILENTVSKINSKVEITRQEITDSAETVRNFIKQYLQEGLEGAVIKKLDASYKAGARGFHWIKYKKTTDKGVADTVDCLVMGIYRGRGKRAGFGVGAFLIGIKDGEKFKTVSKIGTGLSDEQWRELDDRAKRLTVGEKPKEYEVNKNLEPDVWTSPSLIVEILADEITKSPIHSAGLALRFPRLIKFRDEKSPEDATTSKEVERLFKLQKI